MENIKMEIENIKKLLPKNKHLAYDKMISLNTLNDEIDNYTCYFTEDEDGSILVENVFGDYVEATEIDFLETLKEIESMLEK